MAGKEDVDGEILIMRFFSVEFPGRGRSAVWVYVGTGLFADLHISKGYFSKGINPLGPFHYATLHSQEDSTLGSKDIEDSPDT